MYVEIIVFVYLNLDFLLNRNSYVETFAFFSHFIPNQVDRHIS
jgi:hypothetical protein